MRIHARDDAPAGRAQCDVQARGGLTGRIVDDADARLDARQVLENGARSIGRAAVGEDELELAVEALAPHRRNGALDVALLVEHRGQHAHVDGHAGAPVRNAASAPASASVVCARATTVPASTNRVRRPASSARLRSASATACASPGRDEERGVARQCGDSADVGRNRGQTRGERLDQHLRHPFRPRDVQERIGALVGLSQPGIDPDIAAQGDHVLQPELGDPAGELRLQRPFAVDVEVPRRALTSGPAASFAIAAASRSGFFSASRRPTVRMRRANAPRPGGSSDRTSASATSETWNCASSPAPETASRGRRRRPRPGTGGRAS